MKLTNVLIYNEEHEFHTGTLETAEGKITHISRDGALAEQALSLAAAAASSDEEMTIDGEGCYAIPGLVDIHFHGCVGEDLCDAKPDTIRKMAEYEASQGVTTICPASMTMSLADLNAIMENVGTYEGTTGAHFVGINMEGPFVSPAKKGAQNEKNIRPCSVDIFQSLQKRAKGRIRLVDIAPEEPGAMHFIDAVKDEVVVSIAHTVADYATAREAFRHGANHVTHLFNAMPPFNHREPGVVGAAVDSGAYAELICDGIHIHPAVVRSMFKLIGSDRLCLISDTMRAAGMPDGEYDLGGQNVIVKGNLATLADGTIAGSVTNLMGCLRTVVQKMQIPLEEAIEAASETPARSIGIYDTCGSLSVGKQADVVLLDRELNVKLVVVAGKFYRK